MAWPNTPLTSYSAGTTPYIKAADLNSIQSGINGIINATYSLKAFVVDGTGGSVVSPTAGTGKVSANASSNTAPTTTIPAGMLYKESVGMGQAVCSVAAGVVTVIRLFNVYSTPVRNGTGDFTAVFDWVPTTLTGVVVSGSCVRSGGGYAFVNVGVISAGAGGRLTVQFYTVGEVAGTIAPIDPDGWSIEVKGY